MTTPLIATETDGARSGLVHRKAAAGALCGAGEALAGRHVARCACRGGRRHWRAGTATPHARAADLALALCARRARLRRNDDVVEGSALGIWRSTTRWRAPKSPPSRSRSTVRENGCCGCPARPTSRPHEVECVYIPDADRGTLCISSQVGCTLTCTFCHTGTQRLVRNLTPGEIVGQVVIARDRLGDWTRADRSKRARSESENAPCVQHRHDGNGRAAL